MKNFNVHAKALINSLGLNRNMVVFKDISDSGRIEYHLVRMGTWGFFSDFVTFFEQQYGAVAHVKDDGICSRKWQFYCRDEYFMFEHHDDIGNWFYSCSGNGESSLMEEISMDIESRIK